MDRKRMYCPFMKGMCEEGHVSSMLPWWKRLLGMKAPKCRMWQIIKGKNPQTNKEFEEGDCSIAWMPVVQLETSQRTIGVAQSVQDFRNRVVDELGNPKIRKPEPKPSTQPYKKDSPDK